MAGSSSSFSRCEDEGCSCFYENNNNKVVDNDSGYYTWRCDRSIETNDDIAECRLCNRCMLGAGEPWISGGEICTRCTNKVDREDLLAKIFDTTCKTLKLFPKIANRIGRLHPNSESFCEKCNTTHILYESTQDAPAIGFWDVEKIQKVLVTTLKHTDEAKEFAELFSASLIKKSEKKKATKKKTKKRYADVRKRFIASLFPCLRQLTEEQFDEHVNTKFARVVSEKDVWIAERLIDVGHTKMSESDVIAFAKFISE